MADDTEQTGYSGPEPAAAENDTQTDPAQQEYGAEHLFEGDFEGLDDYKQDKEEALEKLDQIHDRIADWEEELEQELEGEEDLREAYRNLGENPDDGGITDKIKSYIPGRDTEEGTKAYEDSLKALQQLAEDYRKDTEETLDETESLIGTWDEKIASIDERIGERIGEKDEVKAEALQLQLQLARQGMQYLREYEDVDRPGRNVEGVDYEDLQRVEDRDVDEITGEEGEELRPFTNYVLEVVNQKSPTQMDGDEYDMVQDLRQTDEELSETLDEWEDVSRQIARLDSFREDAQYNRELAQKAYNKTKEANEQIKDQQMLLDQFVDSNVTVGKLERQFKKTIETTGKLKEATSTAAELNAERVEQLIPAAEGVRDERALKEGARQTMDEVLSEEETTPEEQMAAIAAAEDVEE
jgi:hypothetical protein